MGRGGGRGAGRGSRRHVGRLLEDARVCSTRAASPVRTVGVEAPRVGEVVAGGALGVRGYARRVVVMLGWRGVDTRAVGGGGTALVRMGARRVLLVLMLMVVVGGRGRSRVGSG